jgi:hypothetical protein
LNVKELGQGLAVLVAIGEGLCRDDVIGRGDVDYETVTANDH